MIISCVIVEDEPLARQLLEQYVKKIPYLELAASFSNPLLALDFLHHHTVDILFSDIQMPEITGMTLLKLLSTKPLIILTTAYPEYAIEGYSLDVMDYLLKPVVFERFLQSVEKAKGKLIIRQSVPAAENISTKDFIFVKDRNKLVKINLNDILYIEGLKDYVIIYTKEKRIVPLQTLKSLESQLPPHQFIRIHNSYIISFDAIETIDKEKVQIGQIHAGNMQPGNTPSDKVFLPVSDTYRKAFRDFIEKKQIM